MTCSTLKVFILFKLIFAFLHVVKFLLFYFIIPPLSFNLRIELTRYTECFNYNSKFNCLQMILTGKYLYTLMLHNRRSERSVEYNRLNVYHLL